MKRNYQLSIIFFVTAIISACGTASKSNADLFAGIGAIAGATIGNKHAKGNRKQKNLITALAAGIGAGIGKGIGRKLDAKDRAKMEATAQKALASNRIQTWSNPRNKTSGKAIPTRTSAVSGRTCRTVREVVVINGRESQQNVIACKSSNGWVIQS